MPIYAYRCEACGFEQDVLQKLSDAPLRECPSCHALQLQKQVTAAGFQLKGSGWYATDFKNNKPPAGGAGAAAAVKEGDAAAKSEGDAGSAKSGDATAAPAPAPAKSAEPDGGAKSASASACSPGCACH